MGPAEPKIPDRMPHPSDDGLEGLYLYKAGLEPGTDFSNLELPRMFIGRSRIEGASFQNTNLFESWFCWNNFIDTDFTDADLQGCDLRASEFERVPFRRANLSGADLRRSFFENCDFEGARMVGARLARRQAGGLRLSASQMAEVSWSEEDGPEPDGG
ncbi:MAG: pentapeptide repeat-containing protein [Phycisphaerales bacterium]|nr:pentapeptide repeat-containing protein [Hyphomonadaceae bacterium]